MDARLGSGKPAELLAALAAAPAGEDTGERGRAVYDAAMRMSPPDRLRARAGLEEYLTGPGVGRALPTDLAVYKLELGKLFLTDGKTAEAKTWLEPAAGPAGPADVRASALIQLGQLATAQKNVGEAEARFKEALAVGGLPNETRGHVRLLCGEGLVRIDKLADAAVAFAQAAREKGPVGLAAACRLAACNARGPALPGGRTSDVDALERCVAALSPDGKWDNPHVGIDHVRTTFEDVIRACVTDGDVKSATRAATLYDRVAAPGRGTELKAETFLGMAYTAAKKPDPTNAAATLAKAAAAEYDALAAAATAPAAKADALRKAAAALTVAGDKATAKERFEQILATPGLSPEAANAVRMDLADATTDPAKAAAVFQQVVEAGGTQAYGARVKLAVAQLDRAKQAMKDYGAEGKARADGWTAAAVTLLEQATTASAVAPTDQAAHEQALFTLGRVKMEHGQYADAAGRLRTLVELYPAAKEGERAKLFLASCLLVEGTAGAGNEARVKDALALLDPLMKSADPFLRTQAGVRSARARLAAKQWQEAVTAAQATADDARGSVEELIALSLAYNGLAEQKRAEQCKVIETRMRRVFADLPDALYTGTGPEYTKAYWKTNWFDWLDGRK